MALQCVRCGFPLEDPSAPACPHCGLPVSASLSPTSAGGGVAEPEGAPAAGVPVAATSVPSAAVAPAQPAEATRPLVPPSVVLPASQPLAPPGAPEGPRRERGGAGAALGRAALAVMLLLVGAAAGVGGTFYASGRGAITLPRAPAARPTATATVTPADGLHFHDSLRTNTYGWGVISGRLFFGPDGYHAKDGVFVAAPIGDVGDGSIMVEVSPVAAADAAGFGLLFRIGRLSAAGHLTDAYIFLVSDGGQWTAVKLVGGQGSVLVAPTFSSAIHVGLGSRNALAVRMAATHFEFFANGTHLGDTFDASLPSGGIGLVADSGVEAVFTNFDVQSPAT